MAIKISGTTVIDDSRNFTNIQEINGLDYPASDGSAGQVLTTDGAGSLSLQDLPPAGPTVEAVASGTLPDGSPVIVNSDGTVSVAGFVTVPEEVGSESILDSQSSSISAAYLSDSKFIIFYRSESESNYPTAVVGTVSESTISFGTRTVVQSTNGSEHSVVYDPNEDKIVFAYVDNGDGGKGLVRLGNVSGDSISIDSFDQFKFRDVDYLSLVYEPNEGKIVFFYGFDDTSGNVQVATVSGNSISFGSEETFIFDRIYDLSTTYDTNNNKVIAVVSSQNGGGEGIVGSVSGDSISFGSPSSFDTSHASSQNLSISYDSSEGKSIIMYADSELYAVVGTVDDDSISFTSPQQLGFDNVRGLKSVYDSSAGKIIAIFEFITNFPDSDAIILPLDIDGNSINSDNSFTLLSNDAGEFTGIIHIPNENISVAIYYNNNSNENTAVSYSPEKTITNITEENFIGFSNAAYSDSQTATVQVIGSTDDAQSGLTPGQSYFVQGDGTLAETAGNPEVFAGTALSNTDILVKL